MEQYTWSNAAQNYLQNGSGQSDIFAGAERTLSPNTITSFSTSRVEITPGRMFLYLVRTLKRYHFYVFTSSRNTKNLMLQSYQVLGEKVGYTFVIIKDSIIVVTSLMFKSSKESYLFIE